MLRKAEYGLFSKVILQFMLSVEPVLKMACIMDHPSKETNYSASHGCHLRQVFMYFRNEWSVDYIQNYVRACVSESHAFVCLFMKCMSVSVMYYSLFCHD